MDFDSVELAMPFLEDGREEWIEWAFKAALPPRIFKSHMPYMDPPVEYPCNQRLQQSSVQCLCPNCAHKFRRIIYVVRDGRDVMYSYYRFRQGLGQNLGMSFSQFMHPDQKHYPGVSVSLRPSPVVPREGAVLTVGYVVAKMASARRFVA